MQPSDSIKKSPSRDTRKDDLAKSSDSKSGKVDPRFQSSKLPGAMGSKAMLERVDGDWPSNDMLEFLRTTGGTPPCRLRAQNRVAFVGSGPMAKELGRYIDVERVRHGVDGPDPLDWSSVEILFVQGAILQAQNGWRRSLLGFSPELRELIGAARENGVPSVLWITEEASALQTFSHLFDAVDLVVVPPHADGVPSNSISLGPPLDVKSFNPITDRERGRDKDSAVFGTLVDGAFELSQFSSHEESVASLEPFLDRSWWLVDSTYSLRNNNHKLDPRLRRRFMGCLDNRQLQNALSFASLYHLPKALTERRPYYAEKRYLQAAASKALVVSDDPGFDHPHVAHIDGPQDLARIAEWHDEDAVGALGAKHLAWRHVVTNRTYFEALSAIFERLGVSLDLSEPIEPHVNVVVPTIRPELIPFVLGVCSRQIYKNFSLSIVANGVSVPDEIARMVDAFPGARLGYVPNDKTIGYCMNYGIDMVEADYWAKIDDDDIYGPHYLSDLMLQRKYVDFDISGKASVINYFELDDSVRVRGLDMVDRPSSFLGGGTFVVRSGTTPFPEDVRGFADTLFLAQASDRDAVVIAADPFNFVQVRRSDPNSHTWTVGAHTLRPGPTRSGLNFNGVIL